MKVLAVVHQDDAPPGTFGDVVRERGHELEVRSFAQGDPPSGAAGYGAAMLFGASMQVDQDDAHPWLADERELIGELIEGGVPTLGVCFGAQLIAQTTGARVGPAARPEIGWEEVDLTLDGANDPVLGFAPGRFAAYQGHTYGFGLPPGGVALGHSEGDQLQAYRLGETTWGVQFHPEVTWSIVEGWIAEHAADGDVEDEAALREQTQANLPRWIGFGWALCARFVEQAEGRAR